MKQKLQTQLDRFTKVAKQILDAKQLNSIDIVAISFDEENVVLGLTLNDLTISQLFPVKYIKAQSEQDLNNMVKSALSHVLSHGTL